MSAVGHLPKGRGRPPQSVAPPSHPPAPEPGQVVSVGSGRAPVRAARAYQRALDFGVRAWVA